MGVTRWNEKSQSRDHVTKVLPISQLSIPNQVLASIMSKPRIRSPSLEIVSYTPKAQPASVSSASAPAPARTNGKKRKSTDSDVTKAKRAKATSAEEPKDPAERWKWINLSKPEMYAALPFLYFFFFLNSYFFQQIERHEN
jgi:hypothetical protein